MPLTDFQSKIAKLLSANRSENSHLAGGAALHIAPTSKRYSNDLDFFHDSEKQVAKAFNDDRELLSKNNYTVEVEITQPGFIRAIIIKDKETCKVDWAHDSAWRFMPTIPHEDCGYQLHPVDIAVNKILALAGRDEARDFLDILYCHKNILTLGALCWAAAGKDPGFTPLSLLDLLKRRGKHRPEEYDKLMLTEKISPVELKELWLHALDDANSFINTRNPDEIGCLYYSKSQKKFVDPRNYPTNDIMPHYGRPGGILPQVSD